MSHTLSRAWERLELIKQLTEALEVADEFAREEGIDNAEWPVLLAKARAELADACTGCTSANCSHLWAEQRKCCPDCSHEAPKP